MVSVLETVESFIFSKIALTLLFRLLLSSVEMRLRP